MKILIADDEALVRQSLALYLKDLGVNGSDITEVSDGQQLVNVFQVSTFHLAFVDIKMPNMNGLEAIEHVRKLSTNTAFYILSGFDDFHYAQSAIRLNVKDYLLKPIRRAELAKIYEQTHCAIEQNKKDLIQSLKYAAHGLLYENSNMVSFQLPCHPILIGNNLPEEIQLQDLLIYDNDKLIALPYSVGKCYMVFLFEYPEHAGYYKEFMQKLIDLCSKNYTVFEGKTITSGENWHLEYQRLSALAECRPALQTDRLYPCSCQAPDFPAAITKLCHQVLQNMLLFSDLDYAGFMLSQDSIIESLSLIETDYPSVTQKIKSFLYHAYRWDMNHSENLKQLFLKSASTIIQQNAVEPPSDEKMLEYIHQHFCEDLSLNSMSDMYSLTPNYFSALFKKKTGKTFIQYLTNLRIEKSKELLANTNHTIHEIAESVGYYSTSYYIKIFSKKEGITPSEYRRLLTSADITNNCS